jgi:hypothetical protein
MKISTPDPNSTVRTSPKRVHITISLNLFDVADSLQYSTLDLFSSRLLLVKAPHKWPPPACFMHISATTHAMAASPLELETAQVEG